MNLKLKMLPGEQSSYLAKANPKTGIRSKVYRYQVIGTPAELERYEEAKAMPNAKTGQSYPVIIDETYGHLFLTPLATLGREATLSINDETGTISAFNQDVKDFQESIQNADAITGTKTSSNDIRKELAELLSKGSFATPITVKENKNPLGS